MNLTEIHSENKSVSAKPLFKGDTGQVVSLQILKKEQLKEHITKTPALLICVEGHVIYNDEKQQKTELFSGDYFIIEPMVKHWLDAVETSNILLFR